MPSTRDRRHCGRGTPGAGAGKPRLSGWGPVDGQRPGYPGGHSMRLHSRRRLLEASVLATSGVASRLTMAGSAAAQCDAHGKLEVPRAREQPWPRSTLVDDALEVAEQDRGTLNLVVSETGHAHEATQEASRILGRLTPRLRVLQRAVRAVRKAAAGKRGLPALSRTREKQRWEASRQRQETGASDRGAMAIGDSIPNYHDRAKTQGSRRLARLAPAGRRGVLRGRG